MQDPVSLVPTETPDDECKTEIGIPTAAIELTPWGEDDEWVNNE